MSDAPKYENDHNVYILGAGFSKDAGFPLVSDFLTQMRESLPWAEEKKMPTPADAIRRVLQFRLEAAAAAHRMRVDVDNMEELFSLASAVGSSVPMEEAIAATLARAGERHQAGIARVRRSVTAAVFRSDTWAVTPGTTSVSRDGSTYWARQMPTYTHHAGILSGAWRKNAMGQRNTVITFNYDMLLEYGLAALGRNYHYPGLTDAHGDSLPILKVHGSLNWKNDGGKVSVGITDYPFRPHIVPPTWQKALSEEYISKVLSEAVSALATATRIILIGFSIPATDQHFKYLLAAGLMRNISLQKIILVDPYPDGPRQRIHGLMTDRFAAQVEFPACGGTPFLTDQRWLKEINRLPSPEYILPDGPAASE